MANYWLIIPTVIMSLIFFGLRHIYVRTARCLKRMESMGMNGNWLTIQIENNCYNSHFLIRIGRSPIFSHTNATINGLTTIRSYKSNETIIKEFNAIQDSNTAVCYLFNSTSRALALWLEFVCVLYMIIVITIFFVFKNGKLVLDIKIQLRKLLLIICLFWL